MHTVRLLFKRSTESVLKKQEYINSAREFTALQSLKWLFVIKLLIKIRQHWRKQCIPCIKQTNNIILLILYSTFVLLFWGPSIMIASLAASDSKPMTSVFYDVIRLESVRGRSDVLIEGHFDGFVGIWTPKCCRPSCGPQKGTSLRHNACFETSRVKFHARVTSVGESGKK